MKWEAIVLIVCFVTALIRTPGNIGKPQELVTPGLATTTIVVGLVWIWLAARLGVS